MVDAKKQAISLRMSSADLRRIKRLGQRLGVRDSDVIRFAVKTMLAKLAPLCDPNMKGRALVPVFVEQGPEMFAHFDLDAVRLDSIINDGLEDSQRVDQHDIQLLAMSGMHASYSSFSMRLTGRLGDGRAADARVDARPIDGHAAGARPVARQTLEHDDDRPARPVRNYLYNKYGYGTVEEFAALSVVPAQKRNGR